MGTSFHIFTTNSSQCNDKETHTPVPEKGSRISVYSRDEDIFYDGVVTEIKGKSAVCVKDKMASANGLI